MVPAASSPPYSSCVWLLVLSSDPSAADPFSFIKYLCLDRERQSFLFCSLFFCLTYTRGRHSCSALPLSSTVAGTVRDILPYLSPFFCFYSKILPPPLLAMSTDVLLDDPPFSVFCLLEGRHLSSCVLEVDFFARLLPCSKLRKELFFLTRGSLTGAAPWMLSRGALEKHIGVSPKFGSSFSLDYWRWGLFRSFPPLSTPFAQVLNPFTPEFFLFSPGFSRSRQCGIPNHPQQSLASAARASLCRAACCLPGLFQTGRRSFSPAAR